MIDIRVINLIINVILIFFILISLLCQSSTILYFSVFILLIGMVATFYSIYKDLKE